MGLLDPKYQEAVKAVQASGRTSTSYIQRCLLISYNRAARIIEAMELDGVVSAADYLGARTVIKKDME